VIHAGEAEVEFNLTGPELPGGFLIEGSDPQIFYEISLTDVLFTDSVEVCLAYIDSLVEYEDSLVLLHYDAGEEPPWVDVTTLLDTAGNVICGKVTELSPFVIAAQERASSTPEASDPGSVRFLALAPNAPNPFVHSTAIRYALPAGGHVRLRVYDLEGRHVRTLADVSQAAGAHLAHWDGRNDRGHEATSGLYLFRLEFGDQVKMRRALLIR